MGVIRNISVNMMTDDCIFAGSVRSFANDAAFVSLDDCFQLPIIPGF
jgi:hypothetical protein